MPIFYKLIAKANPRFPTAPRKYYATPVYGKTSNLSRMAKLVSQRSTTASEGDAFAVLIDVRDIMKEHFERGERVLIDGIGTFFMGLSSEGSDTPEAFHPSLIKKAKLNFQPDAEMKNFIKSQKFEKYVSKDKPNP